jgi:CheY-like chemotaxis protein
MSGKASILVVDDDPTLRSLLVETLDAVGYRVSAASDGVEALAELRRREPTAIDLLLTDIKMPNMDGFALLKKIRRSYPDLPVLFITGVISDEAMSAASPDGFLAKPFRIARLEELIENTLAAKYSAKTASPPRRVLIHVRKPDLRQSLAEAMSFSNYLPFEVTSPEEALEELERGRFDAMITDLDRTDAGNGFVNRLKASHPELPMLLAEGSRESGSSDRSQDSLLDNSPNSLPNASPDHSPGSSPDVSRDNSPGSSPDASPNSPSGVLPGGRIVREPFSAGDLIAALDRTVGKPE